MMRFWFVHLFTLSAMNSARSLFMVGLFMSGCATSPLIKPPSSGYPKSIILVIGDGMGPQQMALLSAAHRRDHREGRGLAQLSQGSKIGMHLPFADGFLTNDSACSATQLGSGCSCRPQQVGIDATGASCSSIIEIAEKAGKRTALVSDTRLTHATPAAFGSHVEGREDETHIALEIVHHNIDILMSGGLSYFVAQDVKPVMLPECPGLVVKGKGRNSVDVLQKARSRGYRIICDKAQLSELSEGPVMGLFAESDMADAFSEGRGSEPTLAEMTEKTLQLANGPEGFFVMVEAGQIDWSAHHNDAAWLMAEMRRLDRVLEVINRFVEQNPDTLVLLTADHETGGFGFSYRDSLIHTPPDKNLHQTYLDYGSDRIIGDLINLECSLRSVVDRFVAKPPSDGTAEALTSMVFQSTKLSLSYDDAKSWIASLHSESRPSRSKIPILAKPFYPYERYRQTALLARFLDPQRNVVWATGGHTSTPVVILAKGPGAERFGSIMHSKTFGETLLSFFRSNTLNSKP